MKEDLNIDKLFKQKFENYEGQVDPSAWANISQSIGAGAASGAGTAGLSGLAKAAIITGIVAVTSVSVWYFNKEEDQPQKQEQQTDPIAQTEENQDINVKTPLDVKPISVDKEIVMEDQDDPLVQEKEEEIKEERNKVQINRNLLQHIDEDAAHILMSKVNESEDSGKEDQEESVTQANQESVNDKESITDSEADNQVRPVKCKLETTVNKNILSYNANAKNHTDVQWHFGDGNEAKGVSGEHQYERPGNYVVTMTVVGEEKTLVRETKITVEGTSRIGKISNIFTPNGDLKNDFFRIDSEGLTNFTITIYDMNGKEVFASNDPDFQWNGENYMGELNKGTYVYNLIAEGEDGAIHKDAGTIQVEF